MNRLERRKQAAIQKQTDRAHRKAVKALANRKAMEAELSRINFVCELCQCNLTVEVAHASSR